MVNLAAPVGALALLGTAFLLLVSALVLVQMLAQLPGLFTTSNCGQPHGGNLAPIRQSHHLITKDVRTIQIHTRQRIRAKR
jgi:hypothetical protein